MIATIDRTEQVAPQPTAGATIRRARLAHGWSQMRLAYQIRALAETNGYNTPAAASLRDMLSKWERDCHVPDGFNRALLCCTLDIDVDTLNLPDYEYAYRPFVQLHP